MIDVHSTDVLASLILHAALKIRGRDGAFDVVEGIKGHAGSIK